MNDVKKLDLKCPPGNKHRVCSWHDFIAQEGAHEAGCCCTACWMQSRGKDDYQAFLNAWNMLPVASPDEKAAATAAEHAAATTAAWAGGGNRRIRSSKKRKYKKRKSRKTKRIRKNKTKTKRIRKTRYK